MQYSKEVADFLNVQFMEIEGSLDIFKKLFNGEWDSDFVVIPPGQIISQRLFL